MFEKTDLKNKAITLRKSGLSYSEILKQIPVAKSTLSLWLINVGLSKGQKQRLTEKKLESAHRGGERRRQNRLKQIEEINKSAKNEIKKLINNPLWLSGTMLYWAEGSKQRIHTVSHGTIFNNSDPLMIKIFILWLKKIAQVDTKSLKFELYIHESGNVEKALNHWTKICSCKKKDIRVYFKRNKIRTNRTNTGDDYHGLIRITVPKSSVLNRKISGWIKGLCEYWGIV